MSTSTCLRQASARESAHLIQKMFAVGLLIVALALAVVSFPSPAPAEATSQAVQSSVSVYLNCPGSISFAMPSSSGSCTSGNFTGVYLGTAQVPMTNLATYFFMSSATGGVKVTFNLKDVTSGKPILSGVAYGSISGGNCSSSSLVRPANITTTPNTIDSGDKLEASLQTIFTGTGTPTFCSGGSSPTLISITTNVGSGAGSPLLTVLLTPGEPIQTTLAGYKGVAENYTNTGSSSIVALVQGVVKDQAGRTVDVLSTSITLSPGSRVTAFLPFKQYPSGSYFVTTIAMTPTYVPISSSAVAEVSL